MSLEEAGYELRIACFKEYFVLCGNIKKMAGYELKYSLALTMC
jgi:hypothetical protein